MTAGGPALVLALPCHDLYGTPPPPSIRQQRLKTSMRIVAINQYYWPDTAATSQLLTDLCEHLAAQGHDVHVVTGRSSYAGSSAALPPSEEHRGVKIERVWALTLGRRTLLHRAADFASFNASALLGALRLDGVDAVLTLSTPPFVASLGMAAKALKGARFIYWVQDLYPDLAVALGALREDGRVARTASLLSSQILSHADAVVALGGRMREHLVARGAHPDRTVVIDNWSDGQAIAPLRPSDNPLRRAWNTLEKFCVMYSGNFGLAHDFVTLNGAFARLGQRPELDLVLVGDGPRKASVVTLAEQRALTSMRFLPLFPRESLGDSLTAADVHLISLEQALSGMVVPSKLYGVMAAGRPSVYVGPRQSDVWRVLVETESGICVENGDVDGLVDALERLRTQPELRARMGENARAAFVERFDRGHALRRWEAVITGEPVPGTGKRAGRAA